MPMAVHNKSFAFRLGRTLAVSLRLTVCSVEYQAMPKLFYLVGVELLYKPVPINSIDNRQASIVNLKILA
jgi:hypothetical protein